MVQLEWEILLLAGLAIHLPVYLDVFSAIFLAAVALIASAVLFFSRSYIRGEVFFLRFHLLVIRFVFSIWALIICPSLIVILIGWDGLGVTSYLLVIYFINSKAYGAGIITALTNRIGDVLILLAIAFQLTSGSWALWQQGISINISSLGCALLITAAITKRAQVPFSAWLPAAIAAPTPVSSLVHSSTLVTAGVYLVFRLRGGHSLSFTIFYLGVATIFLARLRALWEIDIKKIVALSTLSQLGLIFCSIGLGLFYVAFFHLLTHAFFKAILFIAVGNLIHLSTDYQDIRKVGLSPHSLPTTLSFAIVANISLSGLPFLAGFYSKDLILELINMSKFPFIAWLLFYGAVSLTLLYSIRFTYLISWSFSAKEKLSLSHDNDSYINNSIAILWPLAIGAGCLLSYLFFSCPKLICLPKELKNLALTIILLRVAGGLARPNPIKRSQKKRWDWGVIWSLPLISSPLINLVRLNQGALARLRDLWWIPQITLAPSFSFNLELLNQENPKILFQYVLKRAALFLLCFFIFSYVK